MKRDFACTLVLTALLFICSTVRAEPRIVVSSDPAGDEIRRTAHDFFQKVSDADASGAKALFAGATDHEAVIDAEVLFVQSSNNLMKAASSKMDMKVVPGFQAAAGMFDERAEDQLKRPLILNGDLASIAGGSPPDGGLDLQRIDGKWKIIHLTTHVREASVPARFYAGMAGAFNRLRSLVDSGTLRSANELDRSMRGAASELLEHWSLDETERSTGPAMPAATPPAPDLLALQMLIGKHLHDAKVQAVIPSLVGLPHMTVFREEFYIDSHEAGISLSFKALDGEFYAIHVLGPGDPEFAPFSGKLPRTLEFGQSRRSVEQRLGRPDAFYVTNSSFGATYRRFGLLIVYGKRSGKDPLNPLHGMSIFAPDPAASIPATQPVRAGPRLTFRPVLSPQAPGADQAERLMYPRDPRELGVRLLSREILLDETSIADVRHSFSSPTDTDPARSMVLLEMTPAGARKLEAISKNYQGKPIAIVLDGRILVTPLINGKMSNRVTIVLGGADEKEDETRELIEKMQDAVYSLPVNAEEK